MAATTDARAPVGIALAVGALLVVAVVSVAALVPVHDAAPRFGIVTAAVAVFAAASGDQVALAGVVVIAWLLVNGFLINRQGELVWHGAADLIRLMTLVLCAGVGLAAGEGYRAVRDWRARWLAGAAVAELVTELEEESRDV